MSAVDFTIPGTLNGPELELVAPSIGVSTIDITGVNTVVSGRLKLLGSLAPTVGSTNEIDVFAVTDFLNEIGGIEDIYRELHILGIAGYRDLEGTVVAECGTAVEVSGLTNKIQSVTFECSEHIAPIAGLYRFVIGKCKPAVTIGNGEGNGKDGIIIDIHVAVCERHSGAGGIPF